jgi:hypothetical protein
MIHSFGIGVVRQLNADKNPRIVKVLSSLSMMLQDLGDHLKPGGAASPMWLTPST